MLLPGSLTFRPPVGRVSLSQPLSWWDFTFGANWRRPYGKDNDLRDLDQHPVVHVSYADALAYAVWAGKDLPTEAEWEFAARGGLEDADYAWRAELTPGGKHLANTWQGAFPVGNLREDGYARTSPVRAFPANGYGIFDMIGNVWEWTKDCYLPGHEADPEKPLASRQTRAARGKTTVTIRRHPKSGFRARSLWVGRTFAPRTTAAGTDPLRATRNRLTLRSATSAFGAFCETSERPDTLRGVVSYWSIRFLAFLRSPLGECSVHFLTARLREAGLEYPSRTDISLNASFPF
jgi:hypothetical protein